MKTSGSEAERKAQLDRVSGKAQPLLVHPSSCHPTQRRTIAMFPGRETSYIARCADLFHGATSRRPRRSPVQSVRAPSLSRGYHELLTFMRSRDTRMAAVEGAPEHAEHATGRHCQNKGATSHDGSCFHWLCRRYPACSIPQVIIQQCSKRRRSPAHCPQCL